jgi:hypothetical protein
LKDLVTKFGALLKVRTKETGKSPFDLACLNQSFASQEVFGNLNELSSFFCF